MLGNRRVHKLIFRGRSANGRRSTNGSRKSNNASHNFEECLLPNASGCQIAKALGVCFFKRFFKNNLFYIQEDSLALYLIKVNNYKKADDYAPLDYIYSRIKEVIVSKKRIDYLNKIDKELIGDAITKNLYERLD